jgi:hypothetical protein
MEQKQTRCRYSMEGLEALGDKQRLGFAIGEPNSNSYIKVIWDGKKSGNSYHTDFIDMSLFVALLTDEEQEEIVKETEIQVTPVMINSIEKNLSYIKDSGLSEKALVILLKEYIGATKITKKQVEYVIQSLPKLKATYLK